MSSLITIVYYAMTAFVAVLLIWNFIKGKRWQDEVLTLIVLIPFLLRILRLK